MKPKFSFLSHSLRTRITVTMLCVILAALAVTTLLSAVFIRTTESRKSDQLLRMLCLSGQQSLDYYFDSVQNTVTKVTSFAAEDLNSVDNEEKEAVWCNLSNGLHLCITVPVSETQGEWKGLILHISLGAVIVLITASLFLMYYTRRITKPLEQLTAAAEQVERGNYDFALSYDEDDELGRLTRSFKNLSDTVKTHISDLHGQVFLDALTKVKNKGALTNCLNEIQDEINSGANEPAFAIGVFDCDSLKPINDRYGHGKGDIYLKKAANIICEVFKHSPVFRMGGDEFAVILKNEDFLNRDALLETFDTAAEKINAAAAEPWEQVHLSKGFAVFNPAEDRAVTDVMQRADQLMYENKRERKKQRTQ